MSLHADAARDCIEAGRRMWSADVGNADLRLAAKMAEAQTHATLAVATELEALRVLIRDKPS